MKKLIALILTVMLIVSVCPFGAFNLTASAATSGTTGDCTWTLDGTTLTISGNGAMANYSYNSTLPWGKNITEVIIETGVTSIGDFAFAACSALSSITIPDGVTSIGNYAFAGCTSLTSITIPDGVTSIGNSAFARCTSLTSITIPDGVTSIGISAFSECESLRNITIPNGVKSIGAQAFFSCKSLTSITIPDSVDIIEPFAFMHCVNLKNITIPNSITSIGDSAFSYCDSLKNAYYKGTESQRQEISIDSFGNDYLLNATWYYNSCIGAAEHTYDNTSDIQCNECGHYRYITILNGEVTITDCDQAIIGKVTIPSTIEGYPVTSIGDSAFAACSSLTSITIPDSVTSIGNSAFSDCTSLTSITIPKSVTSIGNYAFYNCSALKSVYITDIAAWCNIKFSDSYANPMSYAENLYLNGKLVTKLEIPDGVTSIGDYAFSGCSALSSITIPDSVTSIGSGAFKYCESLTSITIPDGVTTIKGYVFEGCSSLTAITIPDGVTSIGSDAFAYCTSLTSITIPDSVTSIGSYAFYSCSSLKSVYITDIAAWSNIEFGNTYANPLYDGAELYLNNQLVTEITVPETQIIDENRYYNIKSLKNIFLPKELVLVKQNAFYGCSGLENVYFEGTAEEWDAVTVLSGNDYLKNANVYFNCTKIPGGLTGIEITKLPEKLQYIEKKETLDLTGGVLTLYYDGGATKDIDLATLTVQGFNNKALGKQTITVKYGAYSAQFEIEIMERPKTFVSIIQLPDKNQYAFGESLDLTGGKIAVGYPDGTYEILDITADMVSGYDANDIGYQILTVTYGSFSANFIVSVTNDGDLNGDGKVDLLDLVKFKKLLAGVETSTNLPLDFDGDGKTTATDMIMLMGIILAPNKK